MSTDIGSFSSKPKRNVMREAEEELGTEPGELEGTFPPHVLGTSRAVHPINSSRRPKGYPSGEGYS